MQYGHFDDDAREYVITRPDTPRSWSNYLGSTEYGAIITNNAGGYSFFKSAAQGRFTRLRFNSVPTDQPGRYFYLRDNDDGDFWSTSWQPVGKPLGSYKSTCRHGTAYTVIESEYSNIKTEATYFVPLGQNFEYWRLKITNNDSAPRDLSLFTYVEFANNWTVIQDLINLQFSQYIVKADVIDNVIQCAVLGNVPADESDFQNNDQGRWSWMSLSGADVSGFETSREKFIGDYRTYANPVAVESGQCGGSLAHGDNACGSFQANVMLQPGETREIVVMLGIGKAEIGRETTIEYSKSARVEAELQKLKSSWHAKLGRFIVKTPDADFDHMINVWNAYNCLITFAWSRSASLVYNGERDGLGFCDTVQDILGVLPALQDEARERLELMLTGQLSSGGAMPVVKPFAHRAGHEADLPPEEYRSDDCLWLFNTVPAYVAETGDLDFYRKVLPFADAGETTVTGHLRRAIEFNLVRSGAHGLPCGLSADWNDCLQLGYKGESVFVTFQLRLALKVYGEVCALLGENDEENWAQSQLRVLDEAIQRHTWDGDWFVRAYREDGSILGTHADDEGSIFLEPQPWVVLSGAATDEQARGAMQSVYERLATPFGASICAPPFRHTDYHVVRAVLFNEGQKENGGVFCHPQGWVVMAECALGNGDRAWEYYRAFMPSAYNERAEIRQSEPYVHAQSTHAKSSRQYGASRLELPPFSGELKRDGFWFLSSNSTGLW